MTPDPTNPIGALPPTAMVPLSPAALQALDALVREQSDLGLKILSHVEHLSKGNVAEFVESALKFIESALRLASIQHGYHLALTGLAENEKELRRKDQEILRLRVIENRHLSADVRDVEGILTALGILEVYPESSPRKGPVPIWERMQWLRDAHNLYRDNYTTAINMVAARDARILELENNLIALQGMGTQRLLRSSEARYVRPHRSSIPVPRPRASACPAPGEAPEAAHAPASGPFPLPEALPGA